MQGVCGQVIKLTTDLDHTTLRRFHEELAIALTGVFILGPLVAESCDPALTDSQT